MPPPARTQAERSAPSATAPAGQVAAPDPALHEHLVRPWELCHMPLQGGTFDYRMRYLKLPGITLYRERFGLRCRLLGQSPEGQVVIAVPLTRNEQCAYWGRRLETLGALVMMPGGLDVTIAGRHEQIVVLIDLRLFRENLPVGAARALERDATNHLLSAPPKKVQRLGRSLSTLIDRTNRFPGMLRHRAVTRSMTAAVFRHLASTIAAPEETMPPAPPSVRRQGLERALACLRQMDPASVTIPALAKAACVSQRTLEYAFREAFGLTPLAYIMMQRLHAARRDLARETPDRSTVTRVAIRHGFHHPARFAAYYRKRFGEVPSATLNRTVDQGSRQPPPLLPRAAGEPGGSTASG